MCVCVSEWDLVVIGGCHACDRVCFAISVPPITHSHTYILHQILSISSTIMNTLPILLVLDGMVKESDAAVGERIV